MALALVSCEAAHSAPQYDWQPPGFEIAGSGGEVFRYPESLEGPTIILFWATWCPYCKALMPHLQSIVDEFDGRVQVVALNLKHDQKAARRAPYWAAKLRIAIDHLLEPGKNE